MKNKQKPTKFSEGITVLQAPAEHLLAVHALAKALESNACAIQSVAKSLHAQINITGCTFKCTDTAISIK